MYTPTSSGTRMLPIPTTSQPIGIFTGCQSTNNKHKQTVQNRHVFSTCLHWRAFTTHQLPIKDPIISQWIIWLDESLQPCLNLLIGRILNWFWGSGTDNHCLVHEAGVWKITWAQGNHLNPSKAAAAAASCCFCNQGFKQIAPSSTEEWDFRD